MISLSVSLQVVPGHLDDFVEAIRTNAERSFTDEPGCLYFDVSQDLADDHHFTLYELYADEAAVDAHRSAPHFKVWREAVVGPPFGVRSVSITRTFTCSDETAISSATVRRMTVTSPCPISAEELRTSKVPLSYSSTSALEISGAPPPRPVFL